MSTWPARASIGGILLGIGFACGGLGEPAPELDTTQRFEGHGVSFEYPGSWCAGAETIGAVGAQVHSITIESPGNALSIVQVYGSLPKPQRTPMLGDRAESLQGAAGAGLQLESPVLSTTQREIAGAIRDGQVAACSISLLGVDVPRTLRMYEVGPALAFTHVADEDSATVQPGFDRILDTLTRSPELSRAGPSARATRVRAERCPHPGGDDQVPKTTAQTKPSVQGSSVSATPASIAWGSSRARQWGGECSHQRIAASGVCCPQARISPVTRPG